MNATENQSLYLSSFLYNPNILQNQRQSLALYLYESKSVKVVCNMAEVVPLSLLCYQSGICKTSWRYSQSYIGYQLNKTRVGSELCKSVFKEAQ